MCNTKTFRYQILLLKEKCVYYFNQKLQLKITEWKFRVDAMEFPHHFAQKH
jgi:hypothetical protein